MKITENFLWDDDLNYRSKWLYFVLTYLSVEGDAGDGGFFACSQEDLISNTGMAGPTITKCRQELVDNGWLKHEIRLFKGHRVSHYRILVIDGQTIFCNLSLKAECRRNQEYEMEVKHECDNER